MRAEEAQGGQGTLEHEKRKAVTQEESAEGSSTLRSVQKWMAEV